MATKYDKILDKLRDKDKSPAVIVPDGIPAVWDASSGTLPTVVAGTPDRWIISVGGTLPGLGPVSPGDFIVYDGTTWVIIPAIAQKYVSATNEILINTVDVEVVGKQYQSIANANTYLESLPIGASNLRSIGFAGIYGPDVEAIDYATIFGDGATNSKLGKNVSLKTATSVENNFYDCQIGKLTMKDISGGSAVIASIKRTQLYSPHQTQILFGGVTPTSGTWSITVDAYPPIILQYNSTAADIQAAIRALNITHYADIVVTAEIYGFCIHSYGHSSGRAFASSIVATNIDLSPVVKFTTKLIVGKDEIQNITFDSVPVSGQWMLKYEYNSVYYYSSILAFDADATAIQVAVRDIFTQIQVVEGGDLGVNTLTVSGDYSTGFVITLVSYPGASATLFEIELGPVAGTYATYSGTLAGCTTPVTITADNIGVAGNLIENISFDGTLTINQAILNWNGGSPTNTCSLVSGDGTQFPDSKQSFSLIGGIDAYTYNLEGGGTVAGQKCKLESVDLLDFAVTGTDSTLTHNKGNIIGGNFVGLKTLNVIDATISGGTFGNAAIFGGVALIYNMTIEGIMFMYGTTLFGPHTLSNGANLTLHGTKGNGIITVPAGATLNTYECINLQVINGGTWNDYSKEIIGDGDPITGLRTPLQLANGYPQKYYDTTGQLEYRATGLNPGDRILI